MKENMADKFKLMNETDSWLCTFMLTHPCDTCVLFKELSVINILISVIFRYSENSVQKYKSKENLALCKLWSVLTKYCPLK
jgi:hypothetical protein